MVTRTGGFFISNTRLKSANNQAKVKQHPEAELLLSKNYSFCSSTWSKNNRRYSKNVQKQNVCFHRIIWLFMMKVRLKMKNRHINATRIDLQLVTKYIETWSKSVYIFKTFERLQYMPILMPRLPNSMLCLRYKLPEWQELSTQMQSHLYTTVKLGGGVLVSEFLWLIVGLDI